MSKFSIKDLKDLANEIELAANHKDRTIESIRNKKVKEYMKTSSDKLIVNGVTKNIISGVTGVATYSTVAGAMAPAVTVPILTTAMSAPAAAVIAAPIGAPIPIIGPLIAGSIGLSVGLITNMIMGKNQKKELEELSLDVESKQKIITSKIEKEALKLAEKYGEDVDFNERYKYLMAVIAANEELRKIKN